jgi:hypothetical protein
MRAAINASNGLRGESIVTCPRAAAFCPKGENGLAFEFSARLEPRRGILQTAALNAMYDGIAGRPWRASSALVQAPQAGGPKDLGAGAGAQPVS